MRNWIAARVFVGRLLSTPVYSSVTQLQGVPALATGNTEILFGLLLSAFKLGSLFYRSAANHQLERVLKWSENAVALRCEVLARRDHNTVFVVNA